jgi:hypothetical protein
MYSTEPAFVLGFHGCDKSVVEKVVSGQDTLKISKNDYDWLGNGIYFWENNPARALEYAQFLKDHPHRAKGQVDEPAVVGAVIDIGYCLNLLEAKSLRILKQSFELLKQTRRAAGAPMPENLNVAGNRDLLLRKLDCAVIEMTHAYNRETEQPEYDSVRGVFVEGDRLYENSGFNEKNHIQICVRNPNCIKGYFLPRKPLDAYRIP